LLPGAFGGRVAGEGDLTGQDGGGAVAAAVDQQFAEPVRDELHLRGVPVAQFRMLLDEFEMAGVGLGISGGLSAQVQENRPELFKRRAGVGGTRLAAGRLPG
jgi:hypothetical protein